MQDFISRRNSTFSSRSKVVAFFCTIALFAGLEQVSLAESAATGIAFTNSVKEPAAITANAATVAKNTPTIARSQLTDAETQETIDFSIALKMRNFAELQDRVGMHEIIPLEEIRANYFPASADVENVRRWLIAQGFEVLPAAPYELSVFARGTVAQLQRVFGVTFARVQFRGEEHTSAVTAPSLPADVAGPVLSVNGLQPHLHPFPHSVRKAISPGKSIQNQPPYLVSEIAGERRAILPEKDLALAGAHNLENALAALAAADCLGTPVEAIAAALKEFRGLPHRTELIARAAGIAWVNDSKGTNVDATKKSLEGFPGGSVILILGGRDKHGDFPALAPAVARAAREVLTIGEAAGTIEAALAGIVPVERAGTMDRAVERAAEVARSGDTILLSPACASFDQYANYEERGDHFAALARAATGDVKRKA